MSESKGNSNILETLVESSIDSMFLFGKVFWNFTKWCFDSWINFDDKKDLNYFYETTGTKNKLNEVPRQIKIKSDNKQVVKVPTGLNINDFEKTKESLEAYLNYDVDMSLNNGYLEITKANKKELPTVVNYELPKKSNELKIPFAISNEGVEIINFKEEPHVLLTGATGSGKSVTLRNIITSIIYLFGNNMELVLIDFKVVELAIFKKLKQVKSYVTEVSEAKEVIADELKESKERYKLFEELEVTNIYDYNAKVPANKRMKYRFVVIEEFVMLTEDRKKVAMSMLKRLSVIARASGQFIIITGQRFDNTVIDIVIRSQFSNRLCHQMPDEANSKLILDETGAELLNNKGRMIYKRGPKKAECQSYYITDNQIRDIIKPYIKPKSENKPINDKSIEEGNKNVLELNKSTTEHKEELNQVAVTEENNITDLSFLDKL